MAMPSILLGVLGWKFELDTATVGPKLQNVKREAHALVRSVDGLEGTAHLNANIRDLNAKIAEAKSQLKTLDAERAEASAGLDTTAFDAEYKKVQAKLARLEARRIPLAVKLTNVKQAAAEINALERAVGDSTETNLKNQQSVARMREEYNRLADSQMRLQRKNPWTQTEGDRLKIERLGSQMALLRHRTEQLKGTVDDLTPDIEGNRSMLSRWSEGILSARVRVGPMTLSIKALAISMGALAPVLVNLLGGFSALVGAVGAGLVGALGIASAAVTGFGLATLGGVIAVRPLVEQLQNAVKAGDSYADAVQKYGKGSSQAADKLDQFNNSMKGIDPSAKQAITQFTAMRSKWKSLTGDLRKPFFQTAEQGLKTMTALMPIFAAHTKSTFKTAAKGTQEWMKGLRSPEAKRALDDIMGNFEAGLPSMMDGIGNLATIWGRFTALSSAALPGLSKTFETWTSGLAAGTAAGSGFGGTVNDLISKAKSLGSFLAATGRVMVTFFGAGADAGQGLLETMTAAENRWTRWMKSATGQEKLAHFFEQSADGVKQLYGALAPLAKTFLNLGEAFQPITQGALLFARAFGSVVAVITSIPAASEILQQFGALLAAAFVVSKVRAMAQSLVSVIGMLGGLGAAQTAVAGTAAADAAAQAAVARQNLLVATTAAEAAAATEALALAEGQAAASGAAQTLTSPVTRGGGLPALGRGAAGAAPMLARFAGVAGVAALAVGTLYLATKDLPGLVEHTRVAVSQVVPTLVAQKKAHDAVAASEKSVAAAQERVNALTRGGVTDSLALQKAVRALLTAQRDAAQNNKKAAAADEAVTANKEKLTDAQNEYKTAVDAVANADKNHATQLRGSGQAVQGFAAKSQQLREALAPLTLQMVNARRQMEGFGKIGAAAAPMMQKFRSTFGKGATFKVGMTGDRQVASKTMQLSNRLAGMGKKPAVMKVLASTGSAEAKFLRLQAIAARAARNKEIKVKASTAAAEGMLRSVWGASEKIPKDKDVKVKATDHASPVLRTVKTMIDNIHDKTVTLTTVHKDVGGGRAQGGAFAGGGDVSALEKAYERANMRAARSSAPGGRYSQPQYIVGEENRPEWVIASNPAYRDANKGYLSDAAAAFGMTLIPGYKRGKKPVAKTAKKAPADGGTLTAKYDYYHEQADLWASEFDLDKRAYDMGNIFGGGAMGGGSSMSALVNDIKQQIGYWVMIRDLAPDINALLVPHPKQPKTRTPGAHATAHQKKAIKQANAHAQKRYDRLTAEADVASSLQSAVKSEKPASINQIIAGLNLDLAELDAAAGGATAASRAAYLTGSADLARTYTSNIVAPSPTPHFAAAGVGGSGVAGAVMSGGATYRNASPSLTSPSAGAPAPSGSTSRSAGTVINQTNNYAAPPPDPMTYTAAMLFELRSATP